MESALLQEPWITRGAQHCRDWRNCPCDPARAAARFSRIRHRRSPARRARHRLISIPTPSAVIAITSGAWASIHPIGRNPPKSRIACTFTVSEAHPPQRERDRQPDRPEDRRRCSPVGLGYADDHRQDRFAEHDDGEEPEPLREVLEMERQKKRRGAATAERTQWRPRPRWQRPRNRSERLLGRMSKRPIWRP